MTWARHLFAALVAALAQSACSGQPSDTYAGYAEGEYLYLAPREGGTVKTLNVVEGEDVAQGAPLFSLDDARHRQAVENAQASYEAAFARAADIASGAKPAELSEMRAALDLAQKTVARSRELYGRGLVPKAQLDRDEAALKQARAALAAGSAGRSNAIAAAQQEAQAAAAALQTAEINLADRTVAAPAAGRIEAVFHRPGETIAAGTPVVSFLPPSRLKVRFFVPEDRLSKLKLGQGVRIACDACTAPIEGRISFIASEPQFTPPVIYSMEERHKLVYLAEARFSSATLRPGQPVDVSVVP